MLMSWVESELKGKLVDKRNESIGKIKSQSSPDKEYRMKVRYIENNIERELKYFSTNKTMFLIQNEMKLFRKCQMANMRKDTQTLSVQQKREIEELKENLEKNHLLIIQKKEEILTDEMWYKTLVGLNLGAQASNQQQNSMSLERSLSSSFSGAAIPEASTGFAKKMGLSHQAPALKAGQGTGRPGEPLGEQRQISARKSGG